jgi:hypothetical protein
MVGNSGVCTGGTAQFFIGGSSGTCVVTGTDGKVCTYSYLCMKLGGVEFSAGTEVMFGITTGTDTIGGWSAGMSGAVGLGPVMSAGAALGPSGGTANIGGPGGGVAANPSIDFCIFLN